MLLLKGSSGLGRGGALKVANDLPDQLLRSQGISGWECISSLVSQTKTDYYTVGRRYRPLAAFVVSNPYSQYDLWILKYIDRYFSSLRS